MTRDAHSPPGRLPKRVDVTERELQVLIQEQIDRVEPGLVWVDREVATANGPMDHLAVDQDGTPVVIELKVDASADADGLIQAMDYAGWVSENPLAVARFIRAKQPGLLQGELLCDPRIVLISPDFTKRTLSAARVIGHPVTLVRYTVYEQAGGERFVHCDPAYDSKSRSARKTGLEAHSIDDKFRGSRARMKPVYDALLRTAQAALGHFEVYATTDYIAMKRTHVFAALYVYATELYVLVNLGDVAASGRVSVAVDWGRSRLTHDFVLASPADVDEEVVGWIRKSYENS